LSDPRFIAGLTLFVAGYLINRSADGIYAICARPVKPVTRSRKKVFTAGFPADYFGEIVVWSGWALATWSLPGLAFAVWTIANLAPRARSNHLWYRQTFPDYPAERKALLPGLW